MEKISVFSYIDYRKFLEDYYNWRKKVDNKFSYRYFAKKAGFSNPTYYIDIVKGKKNLSDNAIEKFIKGLGLDEREAKFFKYLVKYNQAKTEEEKESYYKKLISFKLENREDYVKLRYIKYYEKWYIPVVREIIAVKPFKKNEVKKIASLIRPKISTKEVHYAIKILLNLSLIEEINGYYYAKPLKIEPDKFLYHQIRILHKEWIDHGKWAVENLDKDKRHVSSLILALTEDEYKKIIEYIEELRNIVKNYSLNSKKEGLKLYQLNIQFIPKTEEI